MSLGENTNISYIIGIGRSGTTLVSNLLKRHQNIHCAPEAVFLVFFLNKFKNKNINRKEFDLMLKHIEIYGLSHPWVGWHFDKNKLIKGFEELTNKKLFVSYEETVKMIYKCFIIINKPVVKTKYILDKNPSYSLYLNQLQEFSSKSKFLLIIRDYRANVLSRKQSVYYKSPNIAYNAYRWRIFNKNILKFHTSHKTRSIIVKYEDLVTENDLHLNKIYNFFDLDPKMVVKNYTEEIELNNKEIPEKYKVRFFKKYSDLNKKVNHSRRDSWKEELSKKEIFICDVFCNSIGVKFGYNSEYKINIFQKFYYHCRYIIPISKAIIEVYKDYIIYYMPPTFKLKKLIERYKKNGFIKK